MRTIRFKCGCKAEAERERWVELCEAHRREADETHRRWADEHRQAREREARERSHA